MSHSSSLRSSVPTPIRERGAAVLAMGKVHIQEGNQFAVTAQVKGSDLYDVSLRREDDEILAWCDCPFFMDNGVCKHVWATILAADGKNYLLGRNGRPATLLSEDGDFPGLDDADDDRFELKPKIWQPPVPKWSDLIRQLSLAEPERQQEQWRAGRELYYVVDVAKSLWQTGVDLEVLYRERKRDGAWGKLKGTRISRQAIVEMPDSTDREILAMLGGTPVPYDWSNRDSVPYGFRLEGAMAPMLIERICRSGRCLAREQRNAPFEDLEPVTWDEGSPWQFGLTMKRDGTSWIINGELLREQDRLSTDQITLMLSDGLVLARGSFARYQGAGASQWFGLLKRVGPLRVPVAESDDFLKHILKQRELPRIAWPEESRISEISSQPKPRLRIERGEEEPRSGADELCAFATFEYDGIGVSAGSTAAANFNPDTRTLIRRDRQAERAHLDDLSASGFKYVPASYDFEGHHHLPTRKLPGAVRDLIAKGWHVELSGRAFRTPGKYNAELTSGIDWFELRATVDFGTAHASAPELLKAIRTKSTLVTLSDGSYGMIPEELLEQYAALLAAGKATGDHIRYSRSQTVLLDALLAGRPGIRVDEAFVRARDHLRSFDRIAPSEQPYGFTGTLRDYQREGLSWMRFLQDLGLGGCLADDMGLGKTAQVLALIEQRRAMRESGEDTGPSLAVVPRSIVFNWKEEAARFTPGVRVLDYSGAERKRGGLDFSRCDLVLTTYGTLRRDITALQDVRFDYVILDEAQAIKNSDSDSAKCARLLQAKHRLAMSGTPVENHLGELFSLFEFLNPGMLGNMRSLSFAGASLRNPDEVTRQTLAMAVRPFMLRRTKEQVARELPARTEQTIYCELDKRERTMYDELRDHFRSTLLGRIEQQGIAKSQMHILEALLRLRQAACHPALLDAKRGEESSAKLEALTAQLAEVLSEGHKVLVFSQFTSLLAIVRRQLDRDGVTYEYLDGRTRDRQSRVERFQADPDCKLFLISLKAGGLGLNLTAADYVFLLDPWWNPAVEAQAIDRAHRIGQSKQVFAYRLIARDTVEEKVVELQSRKRELADSIIRADASLVRDLKREDLEFLLS